MRWESAVTPVLRSIRDSILSFRFLVFFDFEFEFAVVNRFWRAGECYAVTIPISESSCPAVMDLLARTYWA